MRRRPACDPATPTCLAEVVLAAQEFGDLDRPESVGPCSHLLSQIPTGVAKTLAWLLLLLANRPEVQAGIHEELDRALGWEGNPTLNDRPGLPWTSACLSESIRYRTVKPFPAPRRMARVTEAGGYQVPAGAPALVNIHAFHHDERFWVMPRQFLPERFLPGADGARATQATEAFVPFSASGDTAGRDLVQAATWLYGAQLLGRLRFETVSEEPLFEAEVSGRGNFPRPFQVMPVRRR